MAIYHDAPGLLRTIAGKKKGVVVPGAILKPRPCPFPSLPSSAAPPPPFPRLSTARARAVGLPALLLPPGEGGRSKDYRLGGVAVKRMAASHGPGHQGPLAVARL